MKTQGSECRTSNDERRGMACLPPFVRPLVRHSIFGVRRSIFAFLLSISLVPALGQEPRGDGDGGLAGLSAEEVAALRDARDVLERIVGDEGQSEHLRRDAALGLTRIHEALNDWGRAGQLEWYLSQLARPQPGGLQAALAEAAQSAAKAREPHFGRIRDFWRTLDAVAREKQVGISGETERVRKQFESAADHLSKLSWISSPLRGFEVKIPPIDLRGLKPLPEPGKE